MRDIVSHVHGWIVVRSRNGSAAVYRRSRALPDVSNHTTSRKHSLGQRCPVAWSPRVPAKRRRRNIVMQSTYGSSSRGLLS